MGLDAAYAKILARQRTAAEQLIARAVANMSGAELVAELDRIAATTTADVADATSAYVGLLADETPLLPPAPPAVASWDIPAELAAAELVSTLADQMDEQVTQTAATTAQSTADSLDTQPDGWVRRPNPTTPTCGLCISAASQTYTRGDLNRIHDRCSCSTRPVYGDADELTAPYEDAYQSIASDLDTTGRSALSNTRQSDPLTP